MAVGWALEWLLTFLVLAGTRHDSWKRVGDGRFFPSVKGGYGSKAVISRVRMFESAQDAPELAVTQVYRIRHGSR